MKSGFSGATRELDLFIWGKSMIIEKFRRSHPVVSHPDREEFPVLTMQMHPDPKMPRFHIALLSALGARPNLGLLEQSALRLLRETRVPVLVIDELQNVLRRWRQVGRAAKTPCMRVRVLPRIGSCAVPPFLHQ
ncbi:TniB family NTP-binding protein [Actinoallomurus sp. NPDC052274]|uniref:TniB family NTP-binding protein n=1 Tax=Actinoallomurus sp. NPDC052274 TaxID=3155420 RepID=UPI003433108D